MMAARKQPLTDQLEELRAAHASKRSETRRLQEQREVAQRAPGRLSNMLSEAFAADDRKAIARLTKELSEAKVIAAEPWNERIAGAEIKVRHARAEVERFAAENYDRLLLEVRPQADAIQRQQVAALEAVLDAERARADLAGRLSVLIRDAGRVPAEDLRDEPLPVARDARRQLQEGVPVTWPTQRDGHMTIDRPPADLPELAPEAA